MRGRPPGTVQPQTPGSRLDGLPGAAQPSSKREALALPASGKAPRSCGPPGSRPCEADAAGRRRSTAPCLRPGAKPGHDPLTALAWSGCRGGWRSLPNAAAALGTGMHPYCPMRGIPSRDLPASPCGVRILRAIPRSALPPTEMLVREGRESVPEGQASVPITYGEGQELCANVREGAPPKFRSWPFVAHSLLVSAHSRELGQAPALIFDGAGQTRSGAVRPARLRLSLGRYRPRWPSPGRSHGNGAALDLS
jgi:hypothetical protein